MLYMFSQSTSDGVMSLTITFKLGTDVDKAQVQVQNRVAQAESKLPDEVRALGITTNKQSPDLTMVGPPHLAHRALRRGLSTQLCEPAGEGRACAHSRRGLRAAFRLGRLRDARLARPGQGRLPRPHRERRGRSHPRAECAGRRRRRGPAPRGQAGRARHPDQRQGPPHRRGGVWQYRG